EQRAARVGEFTRFYRRLEEHAERQRVQGTLLKLAARMHLSTQGDSAGGFSLRQIVGPVLTRRVPVRNKHIQYDANALPRIDSAKEYSAADIVTSAMKVFARDPAVVSVDSDLATTSGLEAG